MTTLHLARHGQTEWHHENRYAGSSDVQLTDAGRAEADRLAAWATDARLDVLACSTLIRASETAVRVGAVTGLQPLSDQRLREVSFGDAEGMTAQEMQDAFPQARASFVASPATRPLPGGETGADAVARGIAALTDLIADNPDGRVLVVAHTTLIRLLLCTMIGLPLDDYRRRFPSLANVAVTTVGLPHGAASLRGGAELRALNVPPLSAR